MTLSIMAQYCYAECRLWYESILLSVKYKTFMLSVIMLSNVMLSVWTPRRGASPRLSPAKDYIRQGRKWFWAENTLAYYIMLLMTTADCFIHVAWGKMLYTFFVGPGKTTYTFSVTFRFPLRPFSMLPAGGGGWVWRGNGKYIGISGKHIC